MSTAHRNLATPISVSDARDNLSKALAAFRTGGEHAEPIFFGSHRKPEGVILSYAHFDALSRAALLLEDFGDITALRDRLARSSDPESLDDLARVASELGPEDSLS